MKFYQGNIEPADNVIFVFGSNPEGRHGAGAARTARLEFGAVYGQGEGLQGHAYALPTKDLRVQENNAFRSISPQDITQSIRRLYACARENPSKDFCVAYRNTTERSLNGYTGLEMMDMFKAAGPIPENMVFSQEWAPYFGQRTMNVYAGTEENAEWSNFASRPFEFDFMRFLSHARKEEGLNGIELDVLMYLRYGEIGENMDYEAIMDEVDNIMSSPDNLDLFCEKSLRDEVYGFWFTRESLVRGLNAVYDGPRKKADAIRFYNVEQAFQYAKTYFCGAPAREIDVCRQRILAMKDGGSLRVYGHMLPQLDTETWDRVSFDVMKTLIRESFLQNPALGRDFVDRTEGCTLTHRQDRSKWRELFPQALMEVREELKEAYRAERFEPHVYVTYYGSRHVPEEAFRVQISTSAPENMRDDMDILFQSLYPSFKTMVGPYKNGEIDDAEYTRRYSREVLEGNKEKILTNMAKIIDMAREERKDVYLFCYCRPGAFCHRYLVSNFLNKNGILCQELPQDRLMYQKGRIALFGEEETAACERKRVANRSPRIR